MPRGTRSVFKKRTSLYISREKGKRRSSLHPNTAQRFFSHYNRFLEKLKEKVARKARVNTERVDRIVLMSLGIP